MEEQVIEIPEELGYVNPLKKIKQKTFKYMNHSGYISYTLDKGE